MLKFQSVFSPLMVIMLSLNRAALLYIQQLMMLQLFADLGIPAEDHGNKQVSRGGSVILSCNTSITNATQINWSKDSYYFGHSVSLDKSISNFSSNIDLSSPLHLIILNAQYNDTGLYKCDVTEIKGQRTILWNLTVSEEPEGREGSHASCFFLLILTAVIGFLLCVFTSAVCISRKFRSRTPNQNRVQEQSEEEMTGPQTRRGIRTNKPRSQYTERLNSIYGLY